MQAVCSRENAPKNQVFLTREWALKHGRLQKQKAVPGGSSQDL